MHRRCVIELHLRDLSQPLVDAWTREFAGIASVRTSCGDIFSRAPGRVAEGAPIDIRADAIASPANSFGFMDGGIDAVYTHVLGPGVQDRLRAVLARDHGGEFPVGAAVIVPTLRAEIPWCISAPTMRVPEVVADTVNAYLAFRAALRAVLAHNAASATPITSVLCPGLGTAVGRMSPALRPPDARRLGPRARRPPVDPRHAARGPLRRGRPPPLIRWEWRRGIRRRRRVTRRRRRVSPCR